MISLNTKEYAKIVADKSKVLMMNLLMSSEFYTVNELARAAKIKPHTASYHLKKMQALDLVTMEKHGRFHYYQLTNQEFASFFESIGAITPPPAVRYLSQKQEMTEITLGRTCYDHLAGKLGVALTDYLMDNQYMSYENSQVTITPLGQKFLEQQGLDLEELKRRKRNYCSMCLDWSERRHHVSGSLGHALYELFLKNHWITKSKKNRSVTLTAKGRKELKDLWHFEFTE